ncbi:MAG: polysulfide reductase NrfD [Bacteroidales bacterium]|nr:polysulfide reductase NrfD [Bacteroidales bacterium]MCF8458150.1 polysulfide reductase NrfD [Bacteroidales bacterium]
MAEIAVQEASEKKNLTAIFDDLISPLKRNPFANKLWIRFLILICVAGLFAYGYQLMTGLGATAMRDYSSWGLYISNFVFLIAVSLVGSLVSAILKLSGQTWATPLTRFSEIIAVAAVSFAGLSIIVDMGRPDRVLNILLHGRFSSPIVWDIIVVNTYLAISLILLYLPLIPDIAILRDRYTEAPKWQRKLYKTLSLGWTGHDEQYKLLHKAIRMMMIIIMPVAFAIHTVTSWLFGVNNRTGWDSTIFGPYFVAGAFMVGAAAVIVLMYILRRTQKLDNYITLFHFDKMGKLLVLTSLVYLYFNINEYLVPGYKMKSLDTGHLLELFSGDESPLFYGVQIFGMIIPIILLIFKPMRAPLPLFFISIAVVIGAWLKRYLIVIPTLLNPTFPIQNVPENFHHYFPTAVELTITAGLTAGTLLVITLFLRIFPIVPMWEVAHEEGYENIEKKATEK